jgi:hypothetical protein
MSASSLRRDSRIEGDAHFLLEADELLVRWDRHAHLTRDEDPTAGFGIDAQHRAEALRNPAQIRRFGGDAGIGFSGSYNRLTRQVVGGLIPKTLPDTIRKRFF